LRPDLITICGFMGAGKSRVGELLAAKLDYRFLDLDAEITRREGSSLAEIFRDRGETHFRELERQIGLEVIAGKGKVVALGGGAVTNRELFTAVRKHTYLIYLKARPQTLWRRIKGGDERPLVAGIESYADFLSVYNERMKIRRPLYEQADLVIPTGPQPIPQTVAEILASMGL